MSEKCGKVGEVAMIRHEQNIAKALECTTMANVMADVPRGNCPCLQMPLKIEIGPGFP